MFYQIKQDVFGVFCGGVNYFLAMFCYFKQKLHLREVLL